MNHIRGHLNSVFEAASIQGGPWEGLEREQGEEPRRLFYGRTCAGRHLAVVAAPRPGGVMRPITCWPLSEESAKGYEAWRKTVKR